ncbi:hypothetical protein DPMN_088814, partial [Dreissena polymorpha]
KHAHDTVCYEFEFVPYQTRKKRQAPLTSFVPPTPLTRSRFPVTVNESITILLFTTNNGVCEKIQTTSSFMHLLQPVNTNDFDGNSVCMTEMVVQFKATGIEVIALKYGKDERFYTFLVTGGNVTGPCESPNICQNDGVCFARAENNHTCICRKDYIGPSCERGPCSINTTTCQNGGHCFVNNSVTTCVCKPGYDGQNCSKDIVAYTLHENTWPVIDRTSGIVRNISCIAGKECEVYAFVIYSSRPQVALGYTSKGIDASVEIFETDSTRGLYQVRIGIVSKLAVKHTLCLQTFDNDRTNKDEICFDVYVTKDMNGYVWPQDQPHFVSPSLQGDSIVECVTGKQCRVSYTATPGHGYATKCISAFLSTDVPIIPFEYVIYSNCELCQDDKTSNKKCTFDVVFVPTPYITEEKKICLTLTLRGLQVQGETRCFKVANHFSGGMAGCRKLACHNGGFCDSRYENNPVCFCTKGYTGQACETLLNDCYQKFFATNDMIAVEVKCSTNKTCSYPYNVCGSSNVHIGYFSENLYINILTNNFTNASMCKCSHGSVQIISSTPGSYRFCIQAKSRLGLVEDEICPTVRVSNVSNELSVNKNKPHFVLPTLPTLSTVKCKRGVTCHILVFHTEGYTSPQLCPHVKDTSIQHFEMQHIFTSERTAGVCVTDIAFLVPANQDFNERTAFCLKVSIESKQGEERCYSLQFVDNIFSHFEGPCKGMECYGNSLCIANLANNTADCRCQDGYTGTNCNINIDECRSNPCSNGGTCKDINKYQCQCANGYFGNHCQIDIDCDFDNNSFCGWMNAQTGDNFDWILYRGPTPSDGTGPNVDHTLGNSSGTYAFIETSAPRQSNQSAWLHSPLITPDGETYCLSFWYNMFGPTIGELNVYISGNTVTLPWKVLWSQSRDQGPSWLNAKIEINASDPFMITFEGNAGDGYEGDIALDDIALSVGHCVSLTTVSYQTTTVTRMSVPNTSFTTSPHGMHGTGCYGNPCIRGVCYVHLDEYFCLCPSGFEGLNCQIDADECRSQPCKNGGTCEDDVDNFVCHCVHGYTGKLCDTEIDECVSQPCQHGGQCVDGLNHYTCMCLDGFDGEHCQNVLDPCYDSPCMRGTCFAHLSLFLCVCPPGYSGKFCEKGQGACDSHPYIDECSSNPCRNNGICHDEAGGFRCECPRGYSGLHCSNGNERKCFSCSGLGTNVTCNRVTTCNSDEVCYVELSSTSNAHSFSVGCRRKAECINSTSYNCTHCCDKDYCNDGGCGLAGYPSRHQRGPICFDCDDMADMSFCTQVTVCAHNQKCTTYGSPFTGYDGKCITQNTQCGFTGGNEFCQSCCSDDFCNYNCTDSYARTTVKP